MAYDDKASLQTSADRNKVNTAMRATPQWRDAITAMGLNPDGPLKLNKAQQQSLAKQLDIPTDDFHIDPAGNINDFHGWKGLPTWAKVAVISGAAIGTAGAAGTFGGGAGAAGAGAGGGAGATTAGGTLASTALPGLAGTGMAVTAPAAVTGGLTTGGVLGLTGVTSSIPTLNRIADLVRTGKSTTDKISDILGSASRGVGDATQAAGQNRISADELRMEGGRDYESQFTNRANLEDKQRKSALADVYRKGWYASNPQVGPSTTGGARPSVPWSENYMSALSGLEQEGMKRLTAPSQYGTTDMEKLERFKPTPPSGLERAGTIATPVLSTIRTIADLYEARRRARTPPLTI